MNKEKQIISLDKFIKKHFTNADSKTLKLGSQKRGKSARDEYTYAKKAFKSLEKKLKKAEKHPEKFEVDYKVDNNYSNIRDFLIVSLSGGYTRAAKAIAKAWDIPKVNEILSLYNIQYSKYEKQYDKEIKSTNNKTAKKAKNNAKAKETDENKDQGLEA